MVRFFALIYLEQNVSFIAFHDCSHKRVGMLIGSIMSPLFRTLCLRAKLRVSVSSDYSCDWLSVGHCQSFSAPHTNDGMKTHARVSCSAVSCAFQACYIGLPVSFGTVTAFSVSFGIVTAFSS